MSTVPAEIQCANPECRLSQTGKCVEGLVEKCPHITRVGATAQAVADDTTEAADSAPDISLAKSERLKLKEASALMRAAPTRVVAIIGPTYSGKTSLIASLCDLFQLGQVGKFRFARSRTLFAFEQACHHARAVSQRNSPETEHTSLATGLGFYHLSIQNATDLKAIHLLFADRSGEEYGSVADDPSILVTFPEVQRADVITVLVNGELLLDQTARHNVRHEILMILQGLLDGGVLSINQRLAVVLTKLDVIQSASPADREQTECNFDSLVNHIELNFADTFHEVRFFKIAAQPATDILPHGYGVSELLTFWSEPSLPGPTEQSLMPRAARAMGRFGIADSGGVA